MLPFEKDREVEHLGNDKQVQVIQRCEKSWTVTAEASTFEVRAMSAVTSGHSPGTSCLSALLSSFVK